MQITSQVKHDGRLNVPYVPSLNCMSIWDMHRRLTWERYSGTIMFNNQFWNWWDVSGTGSAKQGLRQKPSKIPSPFGMATQQHLHKNQGISCFQSYSMWQKHFVSLQISKFRCGCSPVVYFCAGRRTIHKQDLTKLAKLDAVFPKILCVA